MAAAERELRITLSAIVEPLTSGLAKAQTEVRGFASVAVAEIDKIAARGEQMKSVWKDMLEAFVGVEIVDSLVKIAEAANRASDALEIAARVSKNFGKDFDVADMDAWLHKLAASAEGGGYSINEMRDAVQQLATTGASEAQQQRLLVDILGLAAARHISVAEATHLAVMAANGHTEALSRFGIQVKDASGTLMSYAEVMSNWESEVAGAAEQRAKGLDGAFGRLGSSVNDLVRAFGAGLIPIMTGAANAAGAMARGIASLPPGLLDTAAGITAFTLGLTALGLVMPAIVKAIGFFWNGLMLLVDLFGPLIAGIRNLITWLALLRTAFAEEAIAEWLALAPITAIVVAITALVAVIVEAVRGFKDLKAAWDWISNLVSPKMPSMGGGKKADLSGLGGPDKGAQKAIDDWLEAQKARIQGAVEIAAQAVASAQARLEETTSKLEELRAKRDPSKAIGPGSAAEEQRLIAEQMERERAAQAAIAKERQANLIAARQLADLAKALPAGDKDRVKHATGLNAESEKYSIAATKLLGVFEKMGGALAKLGIEMRKALLEPLIQAAAAAKIAADTAFQSSQIGSKAFDEQLRIKFEREHVRRPATAVETAQFGATTAQNDVASKRADLTKAQEDATRIQEEVNTHQLSYEEGLKQLAASQIAVQQASANLATSLQQLQLETAKVLQAQRERAGRDRKEILDKTADKIPGVSTTATGGLAAFNWGSVFADAIANSHAFANIMELVNEIMYTFTQIFQEFEPIIDDVLHVMALLVNGFISLWNTIAKIVSLLGIHVAQLQYINTAFGPASANLIVFFHDIPTLNELATGNVSPLVAANANNPYGAIIQQLQTNNTNEQGWFGSVIGDLAILAGLDWLTGGKFLSGIPLIGNLFQNVGNFIGNGLQQIGQLFVNGWNGLQNWMTTNLGQVGAGIFNIAAGAALLSTSDKGALGFLEKILGVLEIIQGVAQLFGGGSIFGSGGLLSGLLNSASGTGGGLSGLVSKLFGGGSAGSFGTWGASAGLGAGGLGTAGAAAAAATDPAIISAAAAFGVDPATMAAAADAAAQTGLPLSEILGASGGAPVDVAYAQAGAGLGGGASAGGAAAGTSLSTLLAGAGIFAAPFLLSTLLGSGFLGIGSGPSVVSMDPNTIQAQDNWSGNGSTVNPAPQTVYQGVTVGQQFNPQYGSNASGTGGVAQQVYNLLQAPLSSFSAAVQPIVQQLQSYLSSLQPKLANDSDLADGAVPVYGANGLIVGYQMPDGSGAAGPSLFDEFLGGGQTSTQIQQLSMSLLQAMSDSANGIQGNLNGATTGIAGRAAPGVGTLGAAQQPNNVTITNTFNGDINGYNDVQSIAQDLADTTLQSMAGNAYATSRQPINSSRLLI